MWHVSKEIREVNKQSQPQARLLWSIAPFGRSGCISDIVQLFTYRKSYEKNGLTLVGNEFGDIVLLDIFKYENKSFSTKSTPIIFLSMNTRSLILNKNNLVEIESIPKGSWMGVKKFLVWNTNVEHPTNSEGSKKCHPSEITIVEIAVNVNCGWIIRLAIDCSMDDSMVFSAKGDILHKSKKVTFVDSTDSILEIDNKSFSLPEFPTPCASFHFLQPQICLADVRPAYHVLSYEDKAVLGPSVYSKEKFDPNSFRVMSLQGALSLTSKIIETQGCPIEIAVHPNDECILVAVNHSYGHLCTSPLEIFFMRY